MQSLFYYISLPFIYALSLLPFSVLHIFSDFVAFILYKIVKYRLKVVRINLKYSFPEKTEAERQQIEKEFYGIIADYMTESIKSLTISSKQVLQLGEIKNAELFKKYYDKNQNIILSLGHLGSQELLNLYISLFADFPQKPVVIYSRLNNKYFERLFRRNRQKFGSILFPTQEAHLVIEKQEEYRPFGIFLLNDQAAPPNKAYWTQFLNQETSFFQGSEIYAKKFDMPVIYAKITRPKRNHFIAELILITDTPRETPKNFITETHAHLLEENIITDPAIWFWSHKRWKHERDGGLSVYDRN